MTFDRLSIVGTGRRSSVDAIYALDRRSQAWTIQSFLRFVSKMTRARAAIEMARRRTIDFTFFFKASSIVPRLFAHVNRYFAVFHRYYTLHSLY
jgi:hypothetical protein